MKEEKSKIKKEKCKKKQKKEQKYAKVICVFHLFSVNIITINN